MKMTGSNDLSLSARAGLPEALRVLLADYPRTAWEAHPRFTGLVSFWLERHMGFRQILAALHEDAEARLDRKIDHARFGARLSRLGGMLVQSLHGHHQVEDHHYFPVLRGLEPGLERGFDILDRDHHAMDGLLDRFARRANTALRAEGDAAAHDAAAAFRAELDAFGRMLDRHLCDEEEIIVPVILKNDAAGLA